MCATSKNSIFRFCTCAETEPLKQDMFITDVTITGFLHPALPMSVHLGHLSYTGKHLDYDNCSALIALIAFLEAREYNTYSHSFRVCSYAIRLAEIIEYPTPEIPALAFAALLHDVGKIAASDSILLKPGPLNPDEFERLKIHPAIGAKIVRRIGFTEQQSSIIRHHHENWNGHGYPDGLEGEQIPLGSRLFAVADSLDAMTSDRCYRKALSLTTAREEIARCAGTQFDPQVAAAFNGVPDKVWMGLRHQADELAESARLPEFSMDAVAFGSQAPLA